MSCGGYSSKLLLIVIVSVGCLASACSPLDQGSGSLVGSAAGCAAANQQYGAASPPQISTSQALAQSFLVQGTAVTVSNVQLNLVTNATTSSPLPNGSTIVVGLFSDSSGTPGNTRANSPSAVLGAGVLPTTSITPNSQPAFYNIPLISAVPLPPGVYWLVATTASIPSGAIYVAWSGANGVSLPGTQTAAQLISPSVKWTDISGITFAFLIGC